MNRKIISTEPLDSGLHLTDEPPIDTEIGHFLVDASHHQQRLDKSLAMLATGFSRSYLQTLIAQGDVHLNGTPITKPSVKVSAGDVLLVHLRPTPASTCFKPESMPLDIVHEDEHVLVIHKPAGLVVHPAPGHWGGTVLNAVLAHAPDTMYLPRAGIVHRLDKDTSGLMVIAKTRPTMDALVNMMAARQVQRYYIALAKGPWTAAQSWCQVQQAVGRDPVHRLKMTVLSPHQVGAKPARTAIRRLDVQQSHHLLACKLFTGRTHQIRVHLAWLGVPIVGDETYGGALSPMIQRQALHAACLQFEHPVTGITLRFEAPLPADMQAHLHHVGLHLAHAPSALPDLLAQALAEMASG